MMKIIFETYRDLLAIIEIKKAEIEALQSDLDYWIGENSKYPLLSQGASKYGVDVAAKRSDFLYERIAKLEHYLKGYEEIEKEIRENIETLHGLEQKVAKLRFIEGLTYEEIADKLGYSFGSIHPLVSKGDNEMPNRLAQ